jgi:SlyX protein
MLCYYGAKVGKSIDHDENAAPFRQQESEMQERMTEVEIKLAHLEQSVTELSDAMVAQQRTIHTLERTCEILNNRLQSLDAPAAEQPGDEMPPHY